MSLALDRTLREGAGVAGPPSSIGADLPIAAGAGGVLLLLQVAVICLQVAGHGVAAIAVLLSEGLVWLAVCCAVLTGRLTITLPVLVVVAILLRLTVLFADPQFSTDLYRYVWDGRVQAAGINPYRYVPADGRLANLRDLSIFPRINRADYATTIYPPAAQVFFLAVTRLGETVVAMKAALVAMEAVALWGLLRLLRARGLPDGRAAVLAWSPLAVVEIAGSGHVDALMMAFIMLALLARERNLGAATGALLGLAALTKLFPAALVPALWRGWDWRMPAAFGGVLLLGYLPYLGAGAAVLGFLPGYAGEEGIANGSGFWVLRVLRDLTRLDIPTAAYLAVVAFALVALAVCVRRWDDPARSGAAPLALASAAMLVLTPAYPWYFVWLLPLVAIARPVQPGAVLLWLIAIAPLLYVGDPRGEQWQFDFVYGSTFGLALCALVAGRLHRAKEVSP